MDLRNVREMLKYAKFETYKTVKLTMITNRKNSENLTTSTCPGPWPRYPEAAIILRRVLVLPGPARRRRRASSHSSSAALLYRRVRWNYSLHTCVCEHYTGPFTKKYPHSISLEPYLLNHISWTISLEPFITCYHYYLMHVFLCIMMYTLYT